MPSPYPPTPSPAFIPHLAAIEFTIGGGVERRGMQSQVALPATRMYLSLDPRRPGQEVNRWPSDLPWWPFLSPCCLAGRKDAVCCPQAPLTRSPLLNPTRETRLLIPGSSLLMLTFFLPLFLSLPFPIFFSLASAPTLSYFDIVPFFFHRLFCTPVRCK